MSIKQGQYCSFMVRFWKMENDCCPTWVVSLQNVSTGQQLYFRSVEGLIQYLLAEFGSNNNPEGAIQTDGVEIENTSYDNAL